jgi:hypothetical protein
VRAAIYLRISEDKTGEELGVTRQREDCEALIERRGWAPTAEFCDNDVSAAGKVTRPGFVALLAAIERGEVDVVVAWALPRLVRTPRDRSRAGGAMPRPASDCVAGEGHRVRLHDGWWPAAAGVGAARRAGQAVVLAASVRV